MHSKTIVIWQCWALENCHHDSHDLTSFNNDTHSSITSLLNNTILSVLFYACWGIELNRWHMYFSHLWRNKQLVFSAKLFIFFSHTIFFQFPFSPFNIYSYSPQCKHKEYGRLFSFFIIIVSWVQFVQKTQRTQHCPFRYITPFKSHSTPALYSN